MTRPGPNMFLPWDQLVLFFLTLIPKINLVSLFFSLASSLVTTFSVAYVLSGLSISSSHHPIFLSPSHQVFSSSHCHLLAIIPSSQQRVALSCRHLANRCLLMLSQGLTSSLPHVIPASTRPPRIVSSWHWCPPQVILASLCPLCIMATS